jgi:hypothetical protein
MVHPHRRQRNVQQGTATSPVQLAANSHPASSINAENLKN